MYILIMGDNTMEYGHILTLRHLYILSGDK